MELKKLMEHISIIPDYRQAWKVEHKLSDILLLTICAVISGAEGWEDIEGNDSNLLIVFYVQIMPDDLVMQLHRF
ncbi:transposase family protein [Escherichia coli]|nr:transposase family protein [Escherichia coli]